jgi:nitrogen fixation protein FixH
VSKVLTGRKVLFWLVATFAVVIAVNGVFIAEAVRTWPGEDVAHPYLQGNDYNRTLARNAEQAGLGWRAKIAARRESDGVVTVLVSIDARAALPASLSMTGFLRHPMDAGRDRPLVFRRTDAHTFACRLSGVSPGAWDVVVNAEQATPFAATRRIWLS